jgi:hypothetical protein
MSCSGVGGSDQPPAELAIDFVDNHQVGQQCGNIGGLISLRAGMERKPRFTSQ